MATTGGTWTDQMSIIERKSHAELESCFLVARYLGKLVVCPLRDLGPGAPECIAHA